MPLSPLAIRSLPTYNMSMMTGPWAAWPSTCGFPTSPTATDGLWHTRGQDRVLVDKEEKKNGAPLFGATEWVGYFGEGRRRVGNAMEVVVLASERTRMTTPNHKGPWFRCSQWTLLIAVALSAISASWLAGTMQVKRQEEAVAAIEEVRGTVYWSGPLAPVWLRNLLPEHSFQQVESLSLLGTRFTDAGLGKLNGINKLERLSLCWTQVTDAGLENLRGMNELQVLSLWHTQITDAGLEHLKSLNKLKKLNIRRTNVTDEGVQELEHALPNCEICR